MSGKWKYPILIVFVIMVIWGWILINHESRIVILKDTKLMSQAVPDGLKSDNSVIEVLRDGEQAIILEEYGTKEWHILKIRTSRGSVGYIFGDLDYRRVN